MKRIVLLCLAAALCVGAASAQNKKSKKAETATTVFVTDIECENCKKKVLNSIPFERGVKDVQVDVPTKEVTVTYDKAKSSDEALLEAFDRIKVEAEVKPAE